MPSNKYLAHLALSLGEELGDSVSTAGMNNAALTKLVADLEAKKAARVAAAPDSSGTSDASAAVNDGSTPASDAGSGDAAAQADGGTEAVAAPAAEQPAPPPVPSAAPAPPDAPRATVVPTSQEPSVMQYVVAEGHAITGPRGILGPGTKLRPGEYTDESIMALLAGGHIVEKTQQ